MTTWKNSGWTPCKDAEEVGVEAELEDGGAAGLAGELRVDGFVGEGAEGGGLVWRLDAAEHVGVAVPAVVAQKRLRNGRLARLHRGEGVFAGAGVRDAADVEDVGALGLHLLEELLLVGESAGDEELEEGVLVLRRLRAPAERDLDVEAGGMPAREELPEVGGGEGEGAVDERCIRRLRRSRGCCEIE